ncbi:methyltransferase [Streptomyces sp.]|uniref:methyltransferase n=1 Tax=Streptomyces sp. TaxID=1931 RepID=UPI002F3EEF2A
MSTHHPRPDLDLWKQADLVTPMVIRVAATYSVADHIVAGRTTATVIAEAEGLHAGALDRVLRHLAGVGLLHRDGTGYGLTERGRFLLSDHPSGMRALWDLRGALGRADLSVTELAHAVTTGEPGFPVRFGQSFWDDLAADPARAQSFNSLMASNIAHSAHEIAQAYDWSTLGHVMDVGGGNGLLLAALLTAHPTLRGSVLDLPASLDTARRTFADRGVGDRAEALAGSFFDSLPSGADGYILSSVIHNWDDDDTLAILKRCAEAAGERGRVFVIEQTGEDGESPNTIMDLRMLVFFAGKERGVSEIVELARNAGLTFVAAHSAPGRVAARSVVEFTAGPR